MQFMVSASLNTEDPAALGALVPQEQAHVQALEAQGTIQGHYLGADRVHVWVVIQGESHDQVQKTLEAFPLYPYVRELAIAPLA